MDKTVVFAHERLIAYDRACELVQCVAGLLRALPRGEGHLADQLKRASDGVLLSLCEGAGRTSGPDKARFYDIARGSGAEVGAVLTILGIRQLTPAPAIERARRLLHEVVRMLTALARTARRPPATK